MNVTQYQQPREKIQSKGVTALSLVELLQVVIGSGNSKTSAASIARQVETLWQEDNVNYRALTSIEGVGPAKACLVLAVAELANRKSVYE